MMSQLTYAKFILKHKDLVKNHIRQDALDMIMNIAEKCSRPSYKASPKQMYRLEEVYNYVYPKVEELKQEENRRNSLSEFDRLWEDNCSEGYNEPDVGWGSGKYEYLSKERFKLIYDELTDKIKKLERELSGFNYWR